MHTDKRAADLGARIFSISNDLHHARNQECGKKIVAALEHFRTAESSSTLVQALRDFATVSISAERIDSDGTVVLALPSSIAAFMLLYDLVSTRPVFVEDTAYSRLFIRIFEAKGAILCSVSSLMSLVKSGTSGVVATFPDCRVLDESTIIEADFFGKRQAMSYLEPVLANRVGWNRFFVLSPSEPNSLVPVQVSSSDFASQARHATEQLLAGFEAYLQVWPWDVFSWDEIGAGRVEDRRAQRSRLYRFTEAVLREYPGNGPTSATIEAITHCSNMAVAGNKFK